MINMVVRHLPLLAKDHIVLLDGILDGVCSRQGLLTMFLGIGLDTTNLCRMGSPFYLSIIHLQEQSVRKIQPSFGHSPHLGFKFHYPGKEPECDGGPMPDCLYGLVKTIVWSFPIEDPHMQ